MSLSDQDLMAAIQQRDAVAFEALVGRYGDLLRVIAVSMTKRQTSGNNSGTKNHRRPIQPWPERWGRNPPALYSHVQRQMRIQPPARCG